MNEIRYNYDPNLQREHGRIRLRLILLSTLLVGILGLVAIKKGYPMVMNYVDAKRNAKIVDSVEVVKEAPEPTAQATVEVAKPLPKSVLLKVPYTLQAPNGNWNDATGYGEACEEASILMVHYYLSGKKFPNQMIPKSVAIAEMDKMIYYQQKHYGYKRDAHEGNLSMERLGKFAKAYYGYDYRVIELTEDNIKRELADGNVVIVPVMTAPLRDLGGGNYASGNVYHVVPIVGYTSKGVITNDEGFGPGQNYFYKWSVIFKAIDAQKVNSPKRQGLVLIKAS